MKGAGVPRPVQPKSHTQRSATANPKTEGITASQRQRAVPTVSTVNPSPPGSSQNHSAKNPAPTARAAAALSHCSLRRCSESPAAEAPPLRTSVITLICKGSLFQRSHVNHEPILHIILQQTIVSFVDVLNANQFDIGRHVVFAAKVQHLLRLTNAAN